ncbi:NifB/NifX family molybdenum-iron cluster-binding protein [Methanofollis fontis]|uniref:Dinitrogenase iron-molybdenum cofactor biosynthesis protein n=1 Tax=Methanofollis fontis TaxID=2052832 RepID=A0A483CSF2_9EURY|nr:NifB/NifX family molybdenum-iron cluster-binding protein [Methanofollis fontis]TAJ44110.1 dinitrogenase iron-molybdenum cofactor biosynthesis protein [Methanofollis fontis]
MKVGVARDGTEVSQHFGQCEGYAIFEVENGTVVGRTDIASPGHSPGVLPALLAENGATVVIAGGMGPKAVDLFCARGIEVYLGVSGSVEEAIALFLKGELVTSANVCSHDGHDCGHEH